MNTERRGLMRQCRYGSRDSLYGEERVVMIEFFDTHARRNTTLTSFVKRTPIILIERPRKTENLNDRRKKTETRVRVPSRSFFRCGGSRFQLRDLKK